MNLIKLYDKFRKLTKKRKETKKELVSEINKIIKPIFNNTVSNYYNININIKKLDKNFYHPFSNLKCIEIWETDEDEYAKNYCFPISFLEITNSKTLKNTYEKMLTNFHNKNKKKEEKNKILQKIKNEKKEKREYLRLKRKFNK